MQATVSPTPATRATSSYIASRADKAIKAGILPRINRHPATMVDGTSQCEYTVPSISRNDRAHTVTLRPSTGESRCTCEASSTHEKPWCSHREIVVRYELMIAARLNGAY